MAISKLNQNQSIIATPNPGGNAGFISAADLTTALSGGGSFGDLTAGSTKISLGGTPVGAVKGPGVSVDLGTVTLDNLSDVIITTPISGQFLGFNGANWYNAPNSSTGVGGGVIYYLTATPSGISTYDIMQKTPDNVAEVLEPIVVQASTSPIAFEDYISNVAIGGSGVVDAGEWAFDFYLYSDTILGVNTVDISVYLRDVGGIETLLFSVTSNNINHTAVELHSTVTVQQAFIGNVTDKLLIKMTASTTNATPTTITLVHSGTTHYSHINTPLVLRHNDLDGLQGGSATERYHLNLAQHTIATQAASTSVSGYLASTDFTTFNNKQNALTIGDITAVGTDGIGITGGTGAIIGTGVAIAQQAATATLNGYLTSTDWNTFFNKQPAGTYVTAITIASLNGFAGSSSGGATPALTLSTSVTGILKGNGTAISAAVSGTDIKSINTASILGAGDISLEVPLTFSTGLTRNLNTITANLSTGNPGGQTAYGGNSPSENLTLSSTSHVTKGKIILGNTTSFYDESVTSFQVSNATAVPFLFRDWVSGGGFAAIYSSVRASNTATNYVLITNNASTILNSPLGTGGNTVDLRVGGTTEVRVGISSINLVQPTTIGQAVGTVPTAKVHIGAGTATANTAPYKLIPGTNLTVAEAGAGEMDSVAFYQTVNTTSGRALTVNEQIFRLSANGTAIGPTIADYFGATSSFPTVTNGVYEIIYYLYFLKTAAGNVTFTITNTQTYTNIAAEQTVCSDISTNGTVACSGIVTTTTAAAVLPNTASLTNGSNNHVIIQATVEVGTAGNIRLQATEGAGTITPLRGSFYVVRQLSAGNTGTFVA